MPKKDNRFFLHDVMFKIVFGSNDSEVPLRAMLNALLDRHGSDRIETVHFLNPGLDKSHVEKRGVFLDVRVQDETRKQYNLEVQVRRDPFFVERTLYYDSRLYGDQLVPTEGFDLLSPTVLIGLLGFIAFPDNNALHSTFSLRNDKDGRRLPNHLTLHYFELPRLGRVPPRRIATPAEAWLNLLKFGHLYVPGVKPLPVEIMKEEGVAMAIDKLKKARESREARQWAEMYDKAERTRITNLSVARKEGQQDKALEVARRLIARGETNDAISDITGLTQAEIAALRKA